MTELGDTLSSDALRAGLRVVLHEIKNQLSVAVGTISMSEGRLRNEIRPSLDCLDKVDRSIVLLQRLVHDDLEVAVDFDAQSVVRDFMVRLARFVPTLEGDFARLTDQSIRVRAPRGAFQDALAVLLGSREVDMSFDGLERTKIEGHEVLPAGDYARLRCVERSAEVNLEPRLMAEQLTLRVRGCELGRHAEVWEILLPCDPPTET